MASRHSFNTLDPDPDQPSCTIWYIQLRLGRHDYSARKMVTYVTLLIDCEGFPQPFPYERAGKLYRDPAIQSRWPRVAVDQWLADWLPPDTTAALDAAAKRAAADVMDDRAGNLQLLQGGRP
jgi:hypothetical protein